MAKPGHVRVLDLPIAQVRPSPENARLYRPVDPTDSEIVALARSIAEHGVQEPLLITRDHWILSGHRRYAAAKLAGLATVPCRVKAVRKDADHDEFMVLLRECNRQRHKTFDERLREEVLSANPEDAHRALVEYRQSKSRVAVDRVEMGEGRRRHRLTEAKRPFLAAVRKVIEERRAFWPLSDR